MIKPSFPLSNLFFLPHKSRTSRKITGIFSIIILVAGLAIQGRANDAIFSDAFAKIIKPEAKATSIRSRYASLTNRALKLARGSRLKGQSGGVLRKNWTRVKLFIFYISICKLLKINNL